MLKKRMNFLANIFFIPLLLISLLGAAATLLNDVAEASKSGILMMDILIVMLILLFLVRHKKPLFSINGKFSRYLRYFMLGAILFWQFYLLLNMSGFCVWDPGSIMLKAIGKASWVGEDYFSYNPNTFLLLLIEHSIWKGLGQPSLRILTVTLGLINYGLLDSSLLTLYWLGKKYLTQRVGKTAFVLGVVLLGIMPWAVIPYSDIPAFALTAFSLAALISFFSSQSISTKYAYAALSGFLLGLDYLIKPSLVITYIAFAIVALVSVSWHNLDKRLLGTVVVIVIIPLIMLLAFSAYQQHNSYVRIDQRKALPMMHFAAMGATGNGGYTLADVERDEAIKDPGKRSAVATKVWEQRVIRMGWVGYQKFLIKKQVANTADGTFAWGGEGVFLKPFKNYPKSLGQRLFFAGGSPVVNSAVKILIQLVWLGTLLAMLLTVNDVHFIVLLAKYAVVGFSLFLLLFEGGRSRYVIQFLPFILLLAGIGIQKIILMSRALGRFKHRNI